MTFASPVGPACVCGQNFKKQQGIERRRSREEREVYSLLRPFARFQTPEEHAELAKGAWVPRTQWPMACGWPYLLGLGLLVYTSALTTLAWWMLPCPPPPPTTQASFWSSNCGSVSRSYKRTAATVCCRCHRLRSTRLHRSSERWTTHARSSERGARAAAVVHARGAGATRGLHQTPLCGGRPHVTCSVPYLQESRQRAVTSRDRSSRYRQRGQKRGRGGAALRRSPAPGDASPRTSPRVDAGIRSVGADGASSPHAPTGVLSPSPSQESGHLDSAPKADMLEDSEKQLCEALRLLPSQYLVIKDALIKESVRRGFVARDSARKLVRSEAADAGGAVYDLCVQCGWVNIPPAQGQAPAVKRPPCFTPMAVPPPASLPTVTGPTPALAPAANGVAQAEPGAAGAVVG